MEVKALSLMPLPLVDTSLQWQIKIIEADKDDSHLMQSQKGSHHVYSLDVKNIGSEADDVTVQLFCNQPNSSTKYGLVPTIEPCHLSKTGKNNLHISNFELAEQAPHLTIVITWKESGSDRLLQETFTFKQK
ncbi:hypothetical protein AB3N02_00260 [Priestia aryabhattai]|uniref:hypothetical protein n=1 Tax=Priestia aryabhattai TaxID=412384 RepID=UPI00399F0628